MKHRTIHQLREVATVHPAVGQALTRAERLERWAEALEQRGGTVRALRGTEFVPWPERRAMREDSSALTVAFEDPVLRAAGLGSDRYEDGVAFFKLRDDEAHLILCSCYHGETPPASEVAKRVRGVMRGPVDATLTLALPLLVSAGAAIGIALAAAL
ncbi:MAG TPA: hypothetical protein VE650_04885 [Acetobacteraceae bacterium]|nr:hypothetical protein [Acetobacteraceae bacterium]